PLETVQLVVDREPAPPSRARPGVPADLETICLKCLRKEPDQRYASAEALADDLARWLKGEPIAARPAGAAERAWKWARRQPAQAGLVGVSLILLLAVVVGPSAGFVWMRQEQKRTLAAADGEKKANAQAQQRLKQVERGNEILL